jgi:hypothetical protein
MRRWGAGQEVWSGVFALTFLFALGPRCEAQMPPGGATGAGTSELDVPSYERALTRIAEACKNPKEIAEVRKSLPDAWKVKYGEQVYSVPTKEISEALLRIEHDPKGAAQLEAQLKAMEQQAEQLSHASGAANANQSEEKLKKILERGEFQDAAGPSAWDLARARINRWIFEHLLKLFRLFNIRRETGNAIAWGILLVAVVALFYGVYRWVAKCTRGIEFRAEVEPNSSDARHWIQEALAAADRGDFREAVHCAYWASVAHLEDIRLLPRDRARTPRESLRLLEQHPKEQGILQAITRSFELIWYGYRPVSAAEWAGTKKELEKMGCLQASTAPTAPC